MALCVRRKHPTSSNAVYRRCVVRTRRKVSRE